MNLKRKRIACLIALPHHTKFLMPVALEARKRGAEVIFFLTMADYPFERDLIKNGQKFRYLTDYMDNVTAEKIDSTLSRLLDIWKSRCFKWDGFRHWSLFEQSRFFNAAIEEYFCLERFIEKELPDLFIALHERNRWGKLTGHLAAKYGIPYVTFQEGDYHESRLSFSAHTEYSTADLIWGEASRDMLGSHKSAIDKLIFIGNTHLDNAIKTYSNPLNKKRVTEELGIPAGKKIVVVLLDLEWAAVIDKRVWFEFFKGTNNEIIFIFKWHPNALLGTYQKAEGIIKDLSPESIMLYTYDPYSLLAIADYCVTLGKTTLALESLAFGRPLFALPSRDGTKDYYVDMGVAQSVSPLGNWANLYRTIEEGVPPHIGNNIKEYLRKSFYRLDGKAIERAIDIMKYIFESRQPARGKGQGTRGKEQRAKSKEHISGRVSFIIPSGDDAEVLLATLTSLSQNVKYPDWEVVIVVNDENIKGMLSGISGDMQIVDAEGHNLSLLYNKGAEAASGEYLIFLRPGIVYFKDEGLLDGIENSVAGLPLKNPDMTPYCLGIGYDFNFTPYKIQNIEYRAQNTDNETFMSQRDAKGNENNPPSPPFGKGGMGGFSDENYRDAVGGGFIAMSRKIFESIGRFDEEIANHLIEPDICLKAKELNIKVRYLPDCLAFNYKETFFGEDVSDENWKNRVKFFAKWVGKFPKDEDFINFAGDLLKV
ncbi:MAG: glycosyltransferase [Nitrospirota bacterium]